MIKVTPEQVQEEISEVKYIYEGLTTLCVITLKSGWKTDGVAHCANPSWYLKEDGEKYSYQDAMGKLIGMFTFQRHYDTWKEGEKLVKELNKPMYDWRNTLFETKTVLLNNTELK